MPSQSLFGPVTLPRARCCCCCCCWWRRTAGSNQLCLAECGQRKHCDIMTFSLSLMCHFLFCWKGHLSPQWGYIWCLLQWICPYIFLLPLLCYLLSCSSGLLSVPSPKMLMELLLSDSCQQDIPRIHLMCLDCGICGVQHPHRGYISWQTTFTHFCGKAIYLDSLETEANRTRPNNDYKWKMAGNRSN